MGVATAGSSRSIALLIACICAALPCGGCRGPHGRGGDPPTSATDGLFAARGDPALAGWPEPRPWAPPFGVRARRAGGSSLTWRYDGSGAPVADDAALAAIRAAAAEWGRTGAVAFCEATGGAAPDVTISWQRGRHGDCPPFLGWDGGLAHASDPTVAGSAFIHLNADGEWTAEEETSPPPAAPPAAGIARRPLASAGLRAVILHELGHTLGLDHAADPAAAMAELYRGAALRVTPADAAGVHSLYGGGHDAASDLWIASVDHDGVPHAVAPALRRIAPPGITAWDAFDADGDGRDEIVVWPAVDDPARIEPLGAGLCLHHLGAAALLERTEGPALGVIDPARPLLVRGGAPGSPAEIAQRVGEGAPLRIATFSPGGLPLLPAPGAAAGATQPPADSRADAHGVTAVAGNAGGGAREWRTAGAPGTSRALAEGDPLGALVAGEPDRRGVRRFRFAGAAGRGREGFDAIDARAADVDGDGVRELILQGWSPAER